MCLKVNWVLYILRAKFHSFKEVKASFFDEQLKQCIQHLILCWKQNDCMCKYGTRRGSI
jgi:hypothetical protein